MSKRLRNYPDPMEVVEKYGADSLRYYLLSSSVIRAEDLRFNERGVEEISKKLLMRLDNVRSFYDLYADGTQRGMASADILDKWILSRLGELVCDTTAGFERYELDTAARPLASFIDDLSTWYLRRSRDRFKEDGEDKAQALSTLKYVLYTTAHVMAPVMPFFADDLFKRVRQESDAKSVHLSVWPEALPVDAVILQEMANVRLASSQGLQLREREGVKVRQPLSKFSTTVAFSTEWAVQIVADEVNVKQIETASEAALDTKLTPSSKRRGSSAILSAACRSGANRRAFRYPTGRPIRLSLQKMKKPLLESTKRLLQRRQACKLSQLK